MTRRLKPSEKRHVSKDARHKAAQDLGAAGGNAKARKHPGKRRRR